MSFAEYMRDDGLSLGVAAQHVDPQSASGVDASAVLHRRGSATASAVTFGASLLQGYSPATPADALQRQQRAAPAADDVSFAVSPSPSWAPPPPAAHSRPPLPPPPDPAASVPRRRPPDAATELQRQVEALQQKLAMRDAMLADQEQEMQAAEEQAAQLRREAEAGAAEIRRLRAEAGGGSSRAELQQLRADGDRLRQENADLRAAVDELEQARSEGAALTDQAAKYLQSVQDDNDNAAKAARDSLQALPRSHRDSADAPEDVAELVRHVLGVWEKELREAEAEVRHLSAQGRAPSEGAQRRSDEEMEGLRRSEGELRDELRRVRQELEQEREDRARQAEAGRRRLAEAEEEQDRLRERLRGRDGDAATAEQQLRDQLSERTKRCEDLLARAERQQEELDRLNAALRKPEPAPITSPSRPPPPRPPLRDDTPASPVFSPDSAPALPQLIKGDLEKLGSGAAQRKGMWKRRFFVADRDCLQYFEKAADYEAGLSGPKGEPTFMGVRFYHHQYAFVSSFTDRASAPTPPGGAADVAVHPRASDPRYYYFGFVPTKDNQLTSQLHRYDRKFLLRTTDRQVWADWCSFLCRQFNPQLWYRTFPELCGGKASGQPASDVPGVMPVVTAPTSPRASSVQQQQQLPETPRPPSAVVPPPAVRPAAIVAETQTSGGCASGDTEPMRPESMQGARAVLTEELRKSEDRLRRVLEDQEPLRRQLQTARTECADLREALRSRDREAGRQADDLRAAESRAAEVQADVRSLEAKLRAQSEGISAAQAEAVRLREQLQEARQREVELAAAASTPPPPRSPTTPPRRPTSPPASAAVQTSPGVRHDADVAALTRRLQEAKDHNRDLATEQRQVRDRLRSQEQNHDAQISMFCEQVLRDMEAIRLHSQEEIERREGDWRKEVAIWQQLVAEKEQQIVAAARQHHDDADGLDEVRHEQWRVIGDGAQSDARPVLSLKLSQADGFGSYGTRVAVDRNSLVQMSVVDDPSVGLQQGSLHRTWRFVSLGGDQTTVVATLAILPPPCVSPSRGRVLLPASAGHRSGGRARVSAARRKPAGSDRGATPRRLQYP
eukprot:TRINITY_DN4104_c0_g1_i1.p1 TRINITY_DN4104_c0_g1~~TRINITY_DN4104_c0_g1_i1.p1  ORF type:complete len:1094 (+),score=471.24 TRINITY_DN4104_c0_g1_i1:66-3284(+)